VALVVAAEQHVLLARDEARDVARDDPEDRDRRGECACGDATEAGAPRHGTRERRRATRMRAW
jgi:hypothetical protein